MWQDPIVQEVRDAREQHAAFFNFDLRAIYEDLKREEQQSGRKVVSFSPRRIQPVLEENQEQDILHNYKMTEACKGLTIISVNLSILVREILFYVYFSFCYLTLFVKSVSIFGLILYNGLRNMFGAKINEGQKCKQQKKQPI